MNPNDGRVVSNFIVQALRGESITIYGDGTQTPELPGPVDDLIEAMIRMMATEDDFTGPVNTGNPDEFTMLELAERVIRLTGSKSEGLSSTHCQATTRSNENRISHSQPGGSAAGALPSNSNGACKRRSSISSRSSVIDSACDRDSFRPPLYTNGTCRKCDKVGGGSDFHPFFPNRSAIRSAYGSYRRSRVRPGPYIRDPAALFIPCRHACDRFQIEAAPKSQKAEYMGKYRRFGSSHSARLLQRQPGFAALFHGNMPSLDRNSAVLLLRLA